MERCAGCRAWGRADRDTDGQRHAAHGTRTGHHRAPPDRGCAPGASRRGTRSHAANAARDGDAGHRVGGRARDARLCESGGRGDVRLGRRRADRPTDRAPDTVDLSRRHEPRGRPGPRRHPQGRVHVSDRSHRQSRADVGRRTPFRVRDRHHRTPARRGGPSGALDRTGIPDDATESDGVGPDARRAPGARADRHDAARRAPAAPGHRGDEPRTAAEAGDRGWRGTERAAGRGETAARRSDGGRAVAERRAVSSRAAAFRTSRRLDMAGELDAREVQADMSRSPPIRAQIPRGRMSARCCSSRSESSSSTRSNTRRRIA